MSIFYNRYWKENRNIKLGDYHYKWPAIKKLIPVGEKLTILDFGCGGGLITYEVYKMNPQSKIIGIDISEVAIKKAKKKVPQAIFYIIKDGDRLPLKSSTVDFILATDVIEHIYNTKDTMKEFFRILKPEGKILITTPYHGLIKNFIIILFGFDSIFDPAGPHIRFFSKRSLFKLLNLVGLKILKHGYFGRFYPVPRAIYVLAEK